MQFDEKIKTAFEVLRNAAENDFERHRIDVLERDLTSPPQVEIIDENHQKFDGFVYGKCQSDSHYKNLHRVVWYYYTGIEIPAGYEVHHKNWNPANNDISNLQLLSKPEHDAIHRAARAEARKKTKKFVCEICGEEYEGASNGRNRFCPKCRNPEKVCPICGKNFRPAFGRKAVCCSLSCGAKFRYKQNRVIKKCQLCGKDFETIASHNRKYCSHKCATTASWQKRKESKV